MKININNILNSKFTLLIAGFILTGIVGSFLNYQFQKEAWKRQAHYEVVKRQLDQTQEAVEKILLLANKRFYAMQKVFWSLEGFKIEEAKRRWEEYNSVRDEWSIMVSNFRSKIKVFLSPELSYELLDKDDARNYKNKESLHALFVVAHYQLKEFMKYSDSNSQQRRKAELEALDTLSELGKHIGDFSERCYTVYLNKYFCFEKELGNK
ncbi:MAG: hypothetical protein NTX01_04060 [Candidatus Omnitrophica bacterium]|nr:hypothetical protein [Candidatus Omnitrophota bacterium]